jgi:hypothetical protein
LHSLPGNYPEDKTSLHSLPGKYPEDKTSLHSLPGKYPEGKTSLHSLPGKHPGRKKSLHSSCQIIYRLYAEFRGGNQVYILFRAYSFLINNYTYKFKTFI